MQVIRSERVPIKMWAPVDEVESAALDKLKRIARLPWVAHHVAVMPDVHLGRETTVGAVLATRDAVFPAVVGADVGCGISAVQTSLSAMRLPDRLRDLRLALEAAIPIVEHREPAWEELALRSRAAALLAEIPELAGDMASQASRQLGTLGGGNHFLELCVDGNDNLWLMLHSGSRAVGRMLADLHMTRAQALAPGRDPELAAFFAGTPEMEAYRRDLYWAQAYAALNREVLLARFRRVLADFCPELQLVRTISCHHNYIVEENHFGEPLYITRKGAISARAGELGIIPGSMGTKSYVVSGLGNPESFCSASHGAGRRLSRTDARARFSLADLRRETSGVECRKDLGLLDEIPSANKNIDRVMALQQDLVEVVAELRSLLCVKG